MATLFSGHSDSIFNSSAMHPRYAMNFSVRLETASRIRDTTYANARKSSSERTLSVHYKDNFRAQQKSRLQILRRKRLLFVVGFLVLLQVFGVLMYTTSKGAESRLIEEKIDIAIHSPSRVMREVNDPPCLTSDDLEVESQQYLLPCGSILRKLTSLKKTIP